MDIGFLNLNKPAGWTSHDCVAKIRRILQLKKVGHGGTLDPMATGVLPIAIGKATRLLQLLPTQKAYRGTVRLGMTTNTDDLEGEIIERVSANKVTLEQIKSCLANFIGVIEQRPPAFSAIKKGGQKLYKLARKGETIEVPKRQVTIETINILAWREGEFPELDLTIVCGGGTYIRAIARDLGEMLGVGGTLASLTRTLSGGMELRDSLTLAEIQQRQAEGRLNLISPDLPLQYMPEIVLGENEAKRWCQGQKISYPAGEIFKARSPWLRVYHGEQMEPLRSPQVFLGISEIVHRDSETLICPKLTLSPSNQIES